MRVWVTRTAPQADATAVRIEALGHEAIVAPVLRAQTLANAKIDLTGVAALAFTSGQAVAAFATLSAERTLPVYATGAGTAAAAEAAGFRTITHAGGDAEALADLIAAAEPRPALVLHPAARDPAADLVALLAGQGVMARALPVYETVLSDLIAAPRPIDAVLIHSAKGAERAAALLGQAARTLQVFAISEAAAAPLRAAGFTTIAIAAAPTEAALTDLLR